SHLTSKVTLDLEVGVDVVTELDDVVVGEVTGAKVRADAGRREDFLGAGASHAIDVGKRDLHPLFAGQIHAGKTCHAGGSPDFSRRRCLVRVRLCALPRSTQADPGTELRPSIRRW